MRIFPRFDITSIGANAVSQFIGRLITSATGFVVALIVARQLGVFDFGEFTKVTTYIAFFYLFADFGLNAVFLKKKGAWPEFLGMRIVIAFSLMFISLGILALLPNSGVSGYTNIVRIGIILFAPTVLFQAIITTTNAQFQKQHRYDVATRALLVGSIVSLLLLFFYSMTPLSGLGFLGAAVAVSIGSAVTAVTALILTRRFEPLAVSFSVPTSLSYFIAVFPIGLTLIFNVIYFRFDSFVLTLTRSTVEVGLYGFAYKFFEFIVALPTFYMNAVYPRMLKIQYSAASRLTNIQINELSKMTKKSAFFLLASSLILTAIVFLLSPLLTLVGPKFEGSVAALRILSLGFPFFFLSNLTMWTLIAVDKQRHLVWIYGVSMMSNIACNLWLTPVYGYIASAWITVASEGVVLALGGMMLVKYIRGL